ncbi:MAG: hypothetical protein PHP44_09685 [Kiritimatiellae bacterium]|nr:hypothetical protein [Kiritimatiellia bacterium]
MSVFSNHQPSLISYGLTGWKLCLGLVVVCSGVVFANIPQPSCVLYGQVRSGQGWPMEEGRIQVTMCEGGTDEVTFVSDITYIDAGVNFVMALPLDDGRGIPYDEESVIKGEAFSVTISQYGLELGVIETNLPVVGGPGDVVQMNVTAGEDTDGDGIPDYWELEFVENSGGAYTNISQITREGDFDGDGVNNYMEYLSGTLPYLDYDFFYVEDMSQRSGRVGVTFFSEKGFSYYPEACDGLGTSSQQWSRCEFSETSTGAFQSEPAVGGYDFRTLYLHMTNATKIIRMVVD